MTNTIRPVARDERATWQDFMTAYAAFYQMEMNPDQLDRVWDWIHDPDNDFWCDLALDEAGTAIGFVQYQATHMSLTGSMIVYLSDLFVDPAIRAKGTGRAMIDHVLAFAKDNGYTAVRWLTQENNYRARGLYDSYNPKMDFVMYVVRTPGDEA